MVGTVPNAAAALNPAFAAQREQTNKGKKTRKIRAAEQLAPPLKSEVPRF
jgi:hypothetical protein